MWNDRNIQKKFHELKKEKIKIVWLLLCCAKYISHLSPTHKVKRNSPQKDKNKVFIFVVPCLYQIDFLLSFHSFLCFPLKPQTNKHFSFSIRLCLFLSFFETHSDQSLTGKLTLSPTLRFFDIDDDDEHFKFVSFDDTEKNILSTF